MNFDRLRDMFARQYELQTETYDVNLHEMTPEQRIQYIKDNVLAATDELHEVLGETGWKPWATSRHLNDEAYMNEIVDLWHFVMNLMLATGHHPDFLAEQLYFRYIQKNRKNAKRQEDGYDGVAGKCPGCKRAYDDTAVLCEQTEIGQWCETQHAYIGEYKGMR